MKLHKILILLVIATVILGSCTKEDYTGYSSVKPTNPTISVAPVSAIATVADSVNTSYKFNITMSAAQIVDVKVHISSTGTATKDADYTVPDEVVIPAGRTKASFEVVILADDKQEVTENFKVTVGDARTANAAITPVNYDFTINNYTTGALKLALNWTTDVKDAIGLDLGPTEVVNLRLLIADAADTSVVKTIDGAGFESFEAFNTLDDGTYFIGVDIKSTIDAGQFNAPVTLDLSLTFNQLGVLNNKVLSFPGVMTNENACDLYTTALAKITKTGSDYKIEESVWYSAPDNSSLVGTWQGIDTYILDAGQTYVLPSGVVTKLDGDVVTINRLNFEWMESFWGETVVDSAFVNMEVNWCEGTVNIPEQDYITTLYNGKEYPYTIEGVGYLDISGDYPVLSIIYQVYQDGFSPSKWAYENGYQDEEYFSAYITLDPNGFTKAASGKNVFNPKIMKVDLSGKKTR